MEKTYSVELLRDLQAQFCAIGLDRPPRPQRYETGDRLTYDVQALEGGEKARIRLVVEKFVGGGFAGQVYRVRLDSFESGRVPGLSAGQVYAIKILVPPSGFSRLFRNALYFAGFQGPFQLQTNPAAARAGALWQKLIRRAARVKFDDELSVVDIHATFVDSRFGSCGEISEWVEGRTWRLEVDDHLDLLGRWSRGGKVDPALLGSPEFRAKKEFMARFVEMLHEMGAHEFARQYEWSTCKSQPNCLKRRNAESSAAAGLVAVDFRAGLALLPFLPMSPGDFKLIATGILRGSWVQFDRGNLKTLGRYVEAHGDAFADLRPLVRELAEVEKIYRDSVPDVTHNHVRLLYSRELWSTILASARAGWRIQGLTDEVRNDRFERSTCASIGFGLVGLLPVAGGFLRRIWGRPDWRRHYSKMLTSVRYLGKALRGRRLETVMAWHRAGRLDEVSSRRVADSGWRFVAHMPFAILPGGIHRFLTDARFAKEKLAYLLVRPVRLYFNGPLREQWLAEMVESGKKKNILNDQDAATILSQTKEPFIQKYLKCLVVHMCMMPVTHVVATIAAIVFVITHSGMPRAQAWAIGLGIIAFFQVIPVSPGSLCRGLYVTYLVISERNFKDYNIALFLSYFKYVGYLAFPIQMAYRYPALARFMAGHWATEGVHVVPVFGEQGALLEREVFCWFYNWPLTIRRRIAERQERRSLVQPRYGHAVGYAIAGAAMFAVADFVHLSHFGAVPALKQIWWLAAGVPLLGGMTVTLGAGGAGLKNRVITAALTGVALGVLYTTATFVLQGDAANSLLVNGMWRVFVFALFSTVGAIGTELVLP